jgi:hypothetical protein
MGHGQEALGAGAGEDRLEAAFLDPEEKRALIARLDAYLAEQ